MRVNEQDLIVIKDDNGIEHSFYKLIQFISKDNNKTYLIYTDNKYTDNKLNIYSSIIEKDGDQIKFISINGEEDFKLVNDTIEQLKSTIDDNIQ